MNCLRRTDKTRWRKVSKTFLHSPRCVLRRVRFSCYFRGRLALNTRALKLFHKCIDALHFESHMIRSAGRPLLGACGMSVLLNAISAPGTLAVSHTVLARGRLRREQM